MTFNLIKRITRHINTLGLEANKNVVYKHQNLSQPSTIIQLEVVYISLGLQLKYYIFLGFIYAILLKLSC